MQRLSNIDRKSEGFAVRSDNSGQPLIPLVTMTPIAAALDQAVDTAEGQTAIELLRRLRNLQ
jgi:hypothetical protein